MATPLPKVTVHAVCRSLSKKSETSDGSHLVVTWLQEKEWPLLSLENVESLNALTWKDYAVDFIY
ncbi:hypothetical protein DTL42_00490 [Bremerella cremea]|uniref:Uncharacterized protein n=1 Tax=Bremerella cremea TaxID=1031537 RepID=A0A368KZ59_9BACT|nr:hypothetical protein DTL42_00490 [Bremerella cremea]